jgi:hypothetical protein
VLDGIAGSMDKTSEFQRNDIEGLSDPLVFISWQRGEQQIPVVVRGAIR